MNKDFLIISGEWHNGLPYPTREGTPSGVSMSRFIASKSPFTFLWRTLYPFFSAYICNWIFR